MNLTSCVYRYFPDTTMALDIDAPRQNLLAEFAVVILFEEDVS